MRSTIAFGLALMLGPNAARGDIIAQGLTFSVATAGGLSCATGNHFHSNSAGALGNPPGQAEVGNLNTECVRGLSEFNLAGLAPQSSAFVTFSVSRVGGLFAGVNDFPFRFPGALIYAYVGNNSEDIADYQAATLPTPNGFGTVGAFFSEGLSELSVLSFDITSVLNAAIAANRPSLGVRVQRNGDASRNVGAMTFQDFRLTTDDQTVNLTPEPSTFFLIATGLAALVLFRRRRRED